MQYSIIIPTYNSSKVILRCLDSVLGQTCQDFEILVMDGNSSDETVSLVKSLKSEKIRLYSAPDKGIYDAMNKGIDKSCGEWLLFLGSDDYLFDNDVLKTVEGYLSDDYDVIYGDVESNLPEGHQGAWKLETLEKNRCHQAIFYNRRFFGDQLRYNLKYTVLADFDVNLRWFLDRRRKHRFIPVIISHYSDGGVSSFTKDEVFYKEYGLNKLKYNYHVLSPLYRKRAARQYVSANESNLLIRFVFTIYADIMYVIQKIVQMVQ